MDSHGGAAGPRGSVAIRLGSRTVALLLLVAWTGLIWWLMTGSRVPVGPRYWWMPWARNLFHAPLFGVQAALLALALRPGRLSGPASGPPGSPARAERRTYLAAAALAVAYGLLVEWRQAYIPHRTASGWDVLTDAVGALGVPWALAHALFGWRTVVVFLLGLSMAAAATWL